MVLVCSVIGIPSVRSIGSFSFYISIALYPLLRPLPSSLLQIITSSLSHLITVFLFYHFFTGFAIIKKTDSCIHTFINTLSTNQFTDNYFKEIHSYLLLNLWNEWPKYAVRKLSKNTINKLRGIFCIELKKTKHLFMYLNIMFCLL